MKEDKSPYKTIAEHILNANKATNDLFESQCHIDKVMKNLKSTLILIILFMGFVVNANKQPNILFISIDDLRPELGCYGNEDTISSYRCISK